MAQLREIKTRIESVVKTKKLTQAMKMVAASKFKRATTQVSNARDYGDTLTDILHNLFVRLDQDEIPKLFEKNNGKKKAIILLTADRGLCGGFNSGVLKQCDAFLADHPEDTIELFIVGTKGVQHFKHKQWSVKESYTQFFDNMTYDKIIDVFSEIITQYEDGYYGNVTIIYNQFLSALSSNLVTQKLLPFLEAIEESQDNTETDNAKETISHTDFEYDPSKIGLLSKVAKEYFLFNIFKSLLESQAAEEGARMAAMEAATDNAGDMIKELSLIYNRSRQAQITSEISEIVAGASALE